ncbi:MAG: DUF5132 domain-containing protein, partial [Chloroflexi bacterium]|nr:DUF5132 domain-containing protein [Chloroflexota bacterium]
MFEGLLEGIGSLGLGSWALVAGATVVAGPVLVRTLRPAAKSAIKGYLTLSDRARLATEETRENLQDLVAEARA